MVAEVSMCLTISVKGRKRIERAPDQNPAVLGSPFLVQNSEESKNSKLEFGFPGW